MLKKYIKEKNMSRSKAELSITERFILTYISFKTNNGFKFFMNNETLAEAICCTVASTKALVNKLVREGYNTFINE